MNKSNIHVTTMRRDLMRAAWWRKVLCWLAVFFIGRSLNIWQTTTHGGVI